LNIKLFKSLTDFELKNLQNSILFKEYNKFWNFKEENISYQIEYNQHLYEDQRFVVFDSSNFYLIAFFFINNKKISFFGNPATIITNPSIENIDTAFSVLFKALDILKSNEDLKSIYINHDNKFISKYLNLVINSHYRYMMYIDLANSEDYIKRNIRKSYKSLLNWGKNNLIIYKYNSDNINPEIFSLFKNFHIKVSERQTRSDFSWDLQYQTILNKNAFIQLAYYKNKLASAIYIVHGYETAYYGIAVNCRELMAQNLPIGHFLLYNCILDCKNMNITTFELGLIDNINLNKDILINNFKKGFTNTISCSVAHLIEFND
jgi:hypothetical protein